MGLKAVLDTNVLISALLWRGTPHEILLRAFDRDFQIVLSPDIISELIRVLELKKFRLEKDEIEDFLRIISGIAEITKTTRHLDIQLRHVGDQNIINCAFSNKVDFIVTGDKDLLGLKEVKGIKIVSPKEFEKTLEPVSSI